MKKNKRITQKDRAKYLLVENLFYNDHEFINKLEKIKEKWKLGEIPSYKEYLYGLHDTLNIKNFDKIYAYEKTGKLDKAELKGEIDNAIGKCHQRFIDDHNKIDYQNLEKDIKKLVNEFNLGNQFIKPLLDFLISGWWENPKTMFNLYTINNTEERKMVVEINVNTTLNDIKESWGLIEKHKKELWPDKKTKRISKKTIENFALYFIAKSLKGKQKGIYKDTDLVTKIWDYDPDVDPDIGSLSSLGKEDKKRSQNLRQIRRRMKAKNRDN